MPWNKKYLFLSVRNPVPIFYVVLGSLSISGPRQKLPFVEAHASQAVWIPDCGRTVKLHNVLRCEMSSRREASRKTVENGLPRTVDSVDCRGSFLHCFWGRDTCMRQSNKDGPEDGLLTSASTNPAHGAAKTGGISQSVSSNPINIAGIQGTRSKLLWRPCPHDSKPSPIWTYVQKRMHCRQFHRCVAF